MNKIYKVVWSKARKCYVIASELAYRSGKKSAALLAITACTMSIWGQPAFAADTSMELGPNAIAKGNGAIATGSNTAAIGKGAVATGNNMTAEQLQELLNKKKTYEDNLKTAQSNADASQQAYNKARTEYETADVNNGIVDRANEAIKGYQDQINSTLKPNADTADAAYTKAKNDYDTLYNDFQNRIATIKTLDFTLYQDGSAAGYDLDKMATALKTKTESGTSFNEPVDFYKSYIQNYIKAEGDLRQNKIINGELYAELKGDTTGVFHPGDWSVNDDNNTLSAENASILGYTNNMKFRYASKKRYGDDNTSYAINDTQRIYLPEIKSLYGYSDTKVLNDTEYNKEIANLNTYINGLESSETLATDLKAVSQYYSKFSSSYAISDELINGIVKAYDSAKKGYIDRGKLALDAEHYQYLYENESDPTKKLEYLSAKEKALADYKGYTKDYTSPLYEDIFAKLKNDPTGSTLTEHEKALLEMHNGYDSYKENLSILDNWHNKVTDDLEKRAESWVKTNITDIEDATEASLKSMQDGLDAEIQNKKKAMDDALTAKNTADKALSDMQQKIEETQPTAEQLAEAAKYADKKKAMEDVAAKLAADKAALEKAQQDIGNITDLSHVGENAIAYGTDALVSGADAVGIGTDVIVTGTNAIGMGKGTVVSGEDATAVVQGSNVSGADAASLGSRNTITGDGSTAVGNGHTVLGAASGAFGGTSNVYGDGSYAVGNNNTIGATDSTTNKAVSGQGVNTFVLGSGITTTANNAVILGYGSTDGGNNTVSVGSDKKTRRIVNVSDARLDAASSDAVTGRQLYATNQNIAGFAADIKSNANTISDLAKSVTSTLDSVSSMSESFSSINSLKADASLNNLSAAGKQVISDVAKEAVQNYVKGLNSVSTAKSNILMTSKVAASPALTSRMALGTSLMALPADMSNSDQSDAATKDLDNLTDAGKQSIRDVMQADLDQKADKKAVDEALSKKADKVEMDAALAKKADQSAVDEALSKKADKTAVDEALTKKAEADAANIDINAFTKKLGTGSVSEGNANLVTGDTVFKAIQKTDAGLVKSDGKVMTLGKSDTAVVLDVSGASGARAITGVATNPMDATSAANVGYVNASAQGLHNEIQGVQQSLTDDLKKVGAGAAALAGLHPQDYDPEDKWDFAVGYGNYRGQNASAVAAYYHPNEDTLFNFGTTLGNGNNMVTAGVSFKFGPGGDAHTMSRTALTQENQELKKGMTELHAENVALNKKNASLEKDVNDLKQLVTELQKEVKNHN